ncbi:MAG: uroporphyrinogen-III synthase [Allosphingosinicella sp.]
MSRSLLILRPEPGAEATAARAREMGLEPLKAPLFSVRPVAWTAPDPGGFDAVMLTSAHAARSAGERLTSFHLMPCYAVGEATAAAARAAGFAEVRTGPADGAALLGAMAAVGVGSAFHPCGVDRTDLSHPDIRLHSVPVYASEPVDRLPSLAKKALNEGALALLHSPRAAELFAELAGDRRSRITIVAISWAAAAAAGSGWKAIAVAARPRDEALLELAAKLCQNGRE